MSTIFDILWVSRPGEEPPSTEFYEDPKLIESFVQFTEKLIIWGGSEVIKAWQEFRTHPFDTANPTTVLDGFRKFEEFVFALRKDIGNENNKLAPGDLLRLFINDYDQYLSKTLQQGEAKP